MTPVQVAPLPSTLHQCTPIRGVVVVDTETSGTQTDDGSRVSTVSVAFRCRVHKGILHDYAWPFDQGPVEGKVIPKRGRKVPQRSLFDDMNVAANLPESEWEALMDWLEPLDHVYHNAKFDLHHLLAGTRHFAGRNFLPNLYWDTMISAWVLDPQYPIALKATASRLWGEDETAEQKALAPYLGPKDNPRYDLVPWEVVGPYAAKDAELTYRLLEEHEALIEDPAYKKQRQDFLFEMDVCRALTGMEQRGIAYSKERALEALAHAQKQIKMLVGRLPFKPTEAGARAYFYGQRAAIPHCMTGGGKPSVGACCVRTLIAQDIPGAVEWAQYQKVSHAASAWYESFIDGLGVDGRLRTDFRQAGTISFRFSSKRKNLQALPHDYRTEAAGLDLVPPRQLFHPAEGHRLFEMDLSQAELRFGAKTAKCKTMQEAIESGDPHGVTASELFAVTPESPDWFEKRQIGKRCNFALEYSVGPDTFMKDLEKQTGIVISRQEAEQIIKAWRNLYPEFPQINRRAEIAARRQGFITLVDGRKRYFAPYEELHKAFNQYIQGGIAQTMKRAMVEIDRRWPGTLLLQIHDSLVVEIPEGEEWVAQEMSDLLAATATRMFKTEMESEVKEWKSAA